MEWEPDTWRPYGQWASETSLRNTTWRMSHDSLRSPFFPSRWVSLKNDIPSEIRKKYAQYCGNLKLHLEVKNGFELPKAFYHPRTNARISYINYRSLNTARPDTPYHHTLRSNFREARTIISRGLFADFSESSTPDPLILTCEISAQKVDISWIPPTHGKEVRYLLECTDKESGRKWVFDQSWAQTQRELRTTPGNTYWIIDRSVIAAVYREIKAVFSYDEMTRMYKKCIDFVGTQMHPFEVLYRCKPREYWDEIHHCHDGLMEKYIKDNNGQPANRINGVISGLFFSARVYADGSLPTHSPFGNVRMLVPPGALLDPSINNFYFADFYCNYYTHYVTVVICRKGSETDNYCYMKLHQMNPADNPFLMVSPPRYPHYSPRYYVNSGVWVEIYYTEDVPLWLGSFDSIQTTGAGTSKIGGLPNNKHCGRCNLYPVPYPSDVVVIDDVHDEIGVADITVAEDPPNSTFRVLMNENKSELTEDWEDVVEVICNMVDQVCEVDKQREKDCIAASDAVIDGVLLAMDKELGKCDDILVQKAANLLKDVVKTIRTERAVIERLIRRVGVLQKLHSSTNLLTSHQSSGLHKNGNKFSKLNKGF